MRPWYGWFIWEVEEQEDCDFCTNSPDVLLGFRFWKACKNHDKGNATGHYPDKGPIKKQRDLDLFFFNDLVDVVLKDATRTWGLFILHVILGFVLSLGYFVAVRMTSPLWWKGKLGG